MKAIYFLAASLAFLLTSCFEDSTVIKVNKDGSGLIHHRQYARTDTKEEDVELPSSEDLLANASKMGSNVKVVSINKARNPQGWHGYEVLYEFPDINNVTIQANSSKTDKKAKKEEGMNALSLSFEMEGGILKASFDQPDWNKPANEKFKNQHEGPTIDPYARTKKQPAQKISITPKLVDQDKMMKAISKDLRVGIFIQPASPLESSNALIQKGGLITLMNADMERMYQNQTPDIQNFQGKTREECQALIESIDGLDLDLQKPIIIKFQ